ncbi:MAG: hypothetical protein LQ346_005699, partial [Caloplaca aetnensis]
MDPRYPSHRRQAGGHHPGGRPHPNYPPPSRRGHGHGPSRGYQNGLDSGDDRYYNESEALEDLSISDLSFGSSNGGLTDSEDEGYGAGNPFRGGGGRAPPPPPGMIPRGGSRRPGGGYTMHPGHLNGGMMDRRGVGRYPGDIMNHPTHPMGPGYPPRRGDLRAGGGGPRRGGGGHGARNPPPGYGYESDDLFDDVAQLQAEIDSD